MKSTAILYSHQKPLNSPGAPFNKENLSLFGKRPPPPIQTSSNTPIFITPFNSGAIKGRSPFTTKANYYENHQISVKKIECEANNNAVEKSQYTERLEKNEGSIANDIISQLKARGRIEGPLEENIKLKKQLAEKTNEAEEWKRKLCDERVERKIANKKLESFEQKIKELLVENEKLNQSLNSRLEQSFPKAKSPKGPANPDINIRETMTSKEMENRVKALSQENERLFKENEGLIQELRDVKTSENNNLTSVNREKEEMVGNVRNLETQIEQYRGQLEQYKAKSKDLESELLQSHICISDLEKRLKSMMNQESLNNSMQSVNRRTGDDEVKKLKAIIAKYRQEGGKIQEILENRRKEIDIVKKELDRVRRENRRLLKMRLEWEENMDRERKEKEEYKELIENQSVILRERELELDEKLIEIDEIRKGFLDLSVQQQN